MLDYYDADAVSEAFLVGLPTVRAELDCSVTRLAYQRVAHALRQDVFRAAGEAFAGRVAATRDPDPYPDHASMVRAAERARDGRGPFLVSDVNHGHPYWTPTENYLFRVHHDAVHVLTGAPAFTYRGEVDTARATVEALGGDGLVRAIIMAEIAGQSAHFETRGAFPTVLGMQAVCLRPWAHGF